MQLDTLTLHSSTIQTISQQVWHLSKPSAPVKVLGKSIARIAHDLRSTVRDVPGYFWSRINDGRLKLSALLYRFSWAQGIELVSNKQAAEDLSAQGLPNKNAESTKMVHENIVSESSHFEYQAISAKKNAKCSCICTSVNETSHNTTLGTRLCRLSSINIWELNWQDNSQQPCNNVD